MMENFQINCKAGDKDIELFFDKKLANVVRITIREKKGISTTYYADVLKWD